MAVGPNAGKAGPTGKMVVPAAGMNGAWFRQDMDWAGSGTKTNEVFVARPIKFGEAFLFTTTSADKDLVFNGAVAGDTFTKKTINGVDVIGNPFPATIDINNINTTAPAGSNIQFLNEYQGTSEFYYWYKTMAVGPNAGKAGPTGKMVVPATGMNGAWFRQDIDWAGSGTKTNEVFVARPILGGEAFLFNTTSADKDIEIKCPYSL